MHKFIGLMALLVLAATVACGGMSVEDYAEECGELFNTSRYGNMAVIFWSSDAEGALDFAETEDDFDDADDALEDWKALSPPGELKDYHDAQTGIIELSIYTFQKLTDLSDELDDLRRDARRSEGGDFDDQIEDLVDELDDLRDDRDNARRSEREDLDNQIEDLVDELDDLRDDRDDARRSERGEFDDQIEDFEDEMNDLYDDVKDEWEDLKDEVDDAEEDLSDSVQEVLYDAGCY